MAERSHHSKDLNEALTARVTAATALLEELANDRAGLLDIPDEARRRLLKAAGEVSRPDAILRRQMVKATKRQKKAERTQRMQDAEHQLQETGIRKPAAADSLHHPELSAARVRHAGNGGSR